MGEGMRRAHRLKRPGPPDEIAAGDLEAEPGVVASELWSGDFLHLDAGLSVALRDGGGLRETRFVLGDE